MQNTIEVINLFEKEIKNIKKTLADQGPIRIIFNNDSWRLEIPESNIIYEEQFLITLLLKFWKQFTVSSLEIKKELGE